MNASAYTTFRDIHSYNTRNNSNFAIDYHRINRSRFALNYHAPIMFNRLPHHLRQLPLHSFVGKVKLFLLRVPFYTINEFYIYNFKVDDF